MRMIRTAAMTLAIAILAVTPARAADTVIVGTVGSASANLWPVFIGINKGFFAEQDLKIDVVYVQSSAQMVQQLTAGSLEMTMSTGLVDPIRAIEKGSPIAIVRFESQSPPYAQGFNELGLTVDFAPELPFSGTVVNNGWAKAHPALLSRVLAAHAKSVAWFYQDANRAEAVKMMVAVSSLKQDDVEKAYDFFRKGKFFEPTGKIS